MYKNIYVTENHTMKRLKLHHINAMNVLITTALTQFLYILMYIFPLTRVMTENYLLCKYNLERTCSVTVLILSIVMLLLKTENLYVLKI